IDSDVNLVNHFTPPTTLISGQLDLTWDAGLRASTAVGNYVWVDQNQNGLQDEPASAGVNGVTVTLHLSDTTPLSTTVTANDPLGQPGYYVFDGLTPSTSYYVEFTKPSGFSFTTAFTGTNKTLDSDADTATGRTAAFTLTANTFDTTRDAGLIAPTGVLRLGNLVWRDLNNNGRYDPAAGEYGLNGVRLNLYRDANGNNLADPGENLGSTTTANRLGQPGWYEFANLAAGDYIVALDPRNFAPDGALVGLRTSTGNEPTPDPDNNRNNDDNGDMGATMIASQAITLKSGTEPTDDGDDADGNQTLDFGLIGAASLGNYVWFDSNANGLQDAGEPPVSGVTVELLDALGTAILTTTTDSLGTYGFSELISGTYQVRFSNLPASHSFTTVVTSTDTLNSDPDPVISTTALITITTNQIDLNWDAGLVAPRASLGDRVWDDQNRDGVQDAGEPGLNGVTVALYRADDTLVLTTTTATLTGTDGLYSFTNLPPGDYYVVFGPPPAGYAPTLQNVIADDTRDSDADVVTRRTAVTTLAPGENDPSWDMGVYTFASIGDRVWNDFNRNGLQDGSEVGVSGVAVRLYEPGGNQPVASTTTNASGYYSLTGLIPADYYLEFSLPTGYRTSLRDAGTDDASDSDPSLASFQTITTTL
ncbi:MAG: SdrD B-like domain-containing protein, partial [Chloroflexales bacterium]